MRTITYTINDVARRFNLSAHTLRFYDKEGLLPFVARNSAGNRAFTDADLDWVKLIVCLKDTGMPIKEIKAYCDWARLGSRTVDERKTMLAEHREEVLGQIEQLKLNLQLIEEKLAFYEDPDNLKLMDKLAERAAEPSGQATPASAVPGGRS